MFQIQFVHLTAEVEMFLNLEYPRGDDVQLYESSSVEEPRLQHRLGSIKQRFGECGEHHCGRHTKRNYYKYHAPFAKDVLLGVRIVAVRKCPAQKTNEEQNLKHIDSIGLFYFFFV